MKPEPTPVPLAPPERPPPAEVTVVSIVTTAGLAAAAITATDDEVPVAAVTLATVVMAGLAGVVAVVIGVVAAGRGTSAAAAPDARAAESMDAARTMPMSRRRLRAGIGGAAGSGATEAGICCGASGGDGSVDGRGKNGSIIRDAPSGCAGSILRACCTRITA